MKAEMKKIELVDGIRLRAEGATPDASDSRYLRFTPEDIERLGPATEQALPEWNNMPGVWRETLEGAMKDAEDVRDGLLTFLSAYLGSGWDLDSAANVEKLLFAPLDEMTAHLADESIVARVTAVWRIEIGK